MNSCDISRSYVMGSRGHCEKSHLVLDLSFWSCKVFQGRVTIRLKLVPRFEARQKDSDVTPVVAINGHR
jgi:hypothetical protein